MSLAAFRRAAATFLGAVGLFTAQLGFADSISPTSFSANLALGDSVTVRKTVTVSSGGPTSALVDIVFLFDTTGSMSTAISNAKATATSLINSLNSTYGGGLFSGAAFYNDPSVGLTQNLTSNVASVQAAINGYSAGGGGDYPEAGYAGISNVTANASFRTGSSRFIVVLGDAGFNTNGGATQASTLAALNAKSINLIGVDSCAIAGTCSTVPTFNSAITGLGGTVYSSGTSSSSLAAAINSGVAGSFQNYSTVTVDDLNAGLPQIDVSTVCVSADIGACDGASAVGAFNRSVDRTFTFDVTFTRIADGGSSFSTYGLVNGGIVATEADSFGTGTGTATIPEPGTLALASLALLGMGAARRRTAR